MYFADVDKVLLKTCQIRHHLITFGVLGKVTQLIPAWIREQREELISSLARCDVYGNSMQVQSIRFGSLDMYLFSI